MGIVERLFKGKNARYALAVVTALGIVGLVLIVCIPQYQAGFYDYPGFSRRRPDIVVDKQLFDIINESRRTVMQIVFGAFGGLFGGLFALYFTWQRTKAQRLQADVAEQGHFTDRFTKAIEQLGAVHDNGNPKIEVRLGAIYALERLARDSEKDHQTIVEILCAYIRENAKLAGVQQPGQEPPPLRTDVQAALTVIGRRERSERRERMSGNTLLLDLRGTDLRRANLDSGHFEGVNLIYARLERAFLGDAHLEGAILIQSHMGGANLVGAHLEDAKLFEAHLEKAMLVEAHLERTDLNAAHLEGAILHDAHLEGADLRNARLDGVQLIRARMQGAILYGTMLHGALLHLSDLRTFSVIDKPSVDKAFSPNELSVDQVKSTVGWQSALWSPEAAAKLGLPAPTLTSKQ